MSLLKLGPWLATDGWLDVGIEWFSEFRCHSSRWVSKTDAPYQEASGGRMRPSAIACSQTRTQRSASPNRTAQGRYLLKMSSPSSNCSWSASAVAM